MIDVYASVSHYAADYLAPIWRALPEHERGTFWCADRVRPALHQLGIASTIGRPPRPARVVVVAGAHDVWAVRKMAAHRVVLVEHGAGQGYEPYADPAWSGGPRREDVALFLCPNTVAADRNRAAYPFTPAVVTGSVRVDELRRIQREPQERPVACLSFHHFGVGRVPWAGWALPHYEAGLPDAIAALRAEGWDVIGHGHPRARNHFRALWRRLGVEYVSDFGEVVRRSSVYVCDNSSSQVESAACGISQVLLEQPSYPAVGAGPWWRWHWTTTDLGVHVSEADEIPAAVVRAAGRPPSLSAVRAVVPSDCGDAAARSAAAILEVA